MQIASIQDYISNNAIRLVDTGNHIIINTVPYTKDTNSPIPFNNIPILKSYRNIVGHNAVHPQLNCSEDLNDWYDTAQVYTVNKKAINMIVDNTNPNISYVFPSYDKRTTYALDSQVEPPAVSNPSIYKLTTMADGKVKKEYANVGYMDANSDYDNSTWQGMIHHITQTNDYIFIYWEDMVGTDGNITRASSPVVMKIDKKTLQVVARCYLTVVYLSNQSYKQGSSYYSSGYDLLYNSLTNTQVLWENEGGFLIYLNKKCTASGTSYTPYNHTRILYFSFDTCQVTDLNLEKGTLSDTQLPIGLPTIYDTSAGSGRTSSNTGTKELWAYIPSKYLETDNDIYGYYYSQFYLPTTSYGCKLYYMNHSKNDFMTMNISEIPLVFPEDSTISVLPDSSVVQTNDSSLMQKSIKNIYETMTTNHNGVDYVHIFFKGIYLSPNTDRGIYTFEINEDRTQATFKSFYPALGGSLHDYMVLNEDRSKIVLITQTSFHILKFDTISKSWISVHDEMSSVKSMIQTAENKLYYLCNDHSIQMLDLNGAVMIDFNFEKQSYNYNNVDINSYISIWAKDSEGNYCDTNIKLTITGNAVWQENGIQTLETATSSSGPIEIPFVIKGHTAINVGVDAII